MSVTPTFQGEVQFRRYSDTSTQGQQVVFAVADREALEPFFGMEGKRFMAVLVQIGDDEQPVEPAPRKDTRGPLCREACDLCAMPEFQRFAFRNFAHATDEREECAKAAILGVCEIKSRKELDEDRAAADLFISRFRVPFMRHMASRKQAA